MLVSKWVSLSWSVVMIWLSKDKWFPFTASFRFFHLVKRWDDKKEIITSFSPDRISNKARSRVPSLRSWIRSSTLSGGTRWNEIKAQYYYTIAHWKWKTCVQVVSKTLFRYSIKVHEKIVLLQNLRILYPNH